MGNLTPEDRVVSYLEKTAETFQPGQHEYYGRIALEQALEAGRKGNYGVGAVAVLVTAGEIREYPAQNEMVTGNRQFGHAEMTAAKNFGEQVEPTRIYSRDTNRYTQGLENGLSVYGTLEPCDGCRSIMINTGVKLSVSNSLDGTLVEHNGVMVSDGGGRSIEGRDPTHPLVWEGIKKAIGMRIVLLESLLDKSNRELTRLSFEIFLHSRESIDEGIGSLADEIAKNLTNSSTQ